MTSRTGFNMAVGSRMGVAMGVAINPPNSGRHDEGMPGNTSEVDGINLISK